MPLAHSALPYLKRTQGLSDGGRSCYKQREQLNSRSGAAKEQVNQGKSEEDGLEFVFELRVLYLDLENSREGGMSAGFALTPLRRNLGENEIHPRINSPGSMFVRRAGEQERTNKQHKVRSASELGHQR